MTTPSSTESGTRWYYADASNQPQGPYSCEELSQFLAERKISTATLVIKEGGAEWKPYGETFCFPRSEIALPPIPPPLPAAPPQRAPVSTSQPPAMEAVGLNGSIELFQDRIRINRKGARAVMSGLNGDKVIFLSQITAVQFKEAGLMHGYIQFSFPGASTAVRGALQAASDENSMIFDKKRQPAFERIKMAVENYQATGTIGIERQVTDSTSSFSTDAPKTNNTGCVVLLLVLFWPLGLLLMWKNQVFSRQTRLVITAIVPVIFGIPLAVSAGILRIVLFLLMFVCPIGLFRMWREPMFTKNVRLGVTGAFAVALCSTIAIRMGESSPLPSYSPSQSSSQSTPEPTPKQTLPYIVAGKANMPLEQQLALVNANKGSLPSDDASIARFRYLLERAAAKTGDSQKEIADAACKGQGLVRENGKSVTLLNFMEGVNRFLATPGLPQMKYYDAALMVAIEASK